MTDDIVILYGKTKLPADDCKVIFKDKFKKEHEVEISRLIQVFNNNIWENKKSVKWLDIYWWKYIAYRQRWHPGHGRNYMVIERMAMDTEKDKFNKLQQEQRDLEESYRQSIRNKQEREENEAYLKEIKDKLWK